jgi:hypothetical protein
MFAKRLPLEFGDAWARGRGADSVWPKRIRTPHGLVPLLEAESFQPLKIIEPHMLQVLPIPQDMDALTDERWVRSRRGLKRSMNRWPHASLQAC